MKDDFERDPLAEALRASLAARAADAPRGELLAEQIIGTAEREAGAGAGAGRRSWSTWTLPLVAAAAVAGVVVAAVLIENVRPHSSTPPVGSPSPFIPLTSSVPAPTGSVPASPQVSRTAPLNAAQLTGVRIRDLTFVSEDEGWALGSADCTDGSGGRCTMMLHTTDGQRWKIMSTTPFNVPGVSAGCAIRCVHDLRFADSDVGYAFGPDAFLMTTDGGKTWSEQDGGAVALESLDQNVIRVTSPHSGCPAQCDVQVETSSIGSTTWTPSTGAGSQGFGLQLVRGGNGSAYLLALGHPAGGAQHAGSLLYRSTDDGRLWQNTGKEPCTQAGAEVDSISIAAGGAYRLSVLCMTRQPQRWQVATSKAAGVDFVVQPGQLPADIAPELLTGDAKTVLVAAGNGMARSVDGGRTWQRISDVTGHVTFVGFEDDHVGRAVTDGNTIWTTHDAGKNWEPVRFG